MMHDQQKWERHEKINTKETNYSLNETEMGV